MHSLKKFGRIFNLDQAFKTRITKKFNFGENVSSPEERGSLYLD